MYDRDVEFSQRYQLKKVEGTDDIFDLIPAPGTVNNEGTLINKAALLKDVTAALFGLTTDAVPDDVLKILSRFHTGLGNEYVWEKQQTKDIESLINETSTGFGWAATCNYSDSVMLSDGVVTLVSPVSSTFEEAKTVLQGKYFSSPAYQRGKVFKAKSVTQVGSQQTVPITFSEVVLTPTLVTVGYVNSDNSESYPPSEPDGYTYTLLGQLGNKVQLEVGSYIGTGTHGKTNPTVLNLSFVPRIVIVYISGNDSYGLNQQGGYYIDSFLWIYGQKKVKLYNSVGADYQVTFVHSGTTLKWYSTESAQFQLNEKSGNYDYIAIG